MDYSADTILNHVLYCPQSRQSEGMVDRASPCVPSLFAHFCLLYILVKVITHKETAAGGGGGITMWCPHDRLDLGSATYLSSPYTAFVVFRQYHTPSMCLSN